MSDVFSRPECIFNYCPNPKQCKDLCLAPNPAADNPAKAPEPPRPPRCEMCGDSGKMPILDPSSQKVTGDLDCPFCVARPAVPAQVAPRVNCTCESPCHLDCTDSSCGCLHHARNKAAESDVEKMSEAELDAELRANGIDPKELNRKMLHRLEAEEAKYHRQGKTPPPMFQEALRQFRESDNPAAQPVSAPSPVTGLVPLLENALRLLPWAESTMDAREAIHVALTRAKEDHCG
jgi:hypothetical protein